MAIVIASLSGGGAERVAVGLADRWCAAGHEVALITLSSDDADAYRPGPGVERVALDVMGRSSSPLEGLVRGARRARALRRALRARRPHLTLAMLTATNVLAALAHAGADGALVLAERNYPPRSTSSRVWSLLRRVAYRRADAVLALDARGRAWLERHTFARRVEAIPNAVTWPLPRLEPRLAPDVVYPAGTRRLLAVGRLVPQKGFDRLLDAFAEACGSGGTVDATDANDAGRERWHLAILGEGPERAALEARAARLGLAGRVSLPGRVGNVGDWYAAADLYALASRHEGFPGTLLEAMASGLASLAVDCPTGPADIVVDGVDGLLVADDDAALAAGLARAMGDAALRERLGAAAPGVRERFGEARIMAMWAELFARLGVPGPGPDDRASAARGGATPRAVP